MNDEALLRYSRHILLEPIGIEGQQRLLEARVLVITLTQQSKRESSWRK